MGQTQNVEPETQQNKEKPGDEFLRVSLLIRMIFLCYFKIG